MTHPKFVASPDALVRCNCCGEGIAEFNTTWAHREKTIREFAATNGTSLEVNGEEIKLSRKYSYYFQTQMLLEVTKKLFIDLFLVTSVEHYQERIKLNEELWKSCLPKSRAFLPNHFTCKVN